MDKYTLMTPEGKIKRFIRFLNLLKDKDFRVKLFPGYNDISFYIYGYIDASAAADTRFYEGGLTGKASEPYTLFNLFNWYRDKYAPELLCLHGENFWLKLAEDVRRRAGSEDEAVLELVNVMIEYLSGYIEK